MGRRAVLGGLAAGLGALASVLPSWRAEAREARTWTVVMARMKFGALPPSVRVGDTIVWDNQDMFRHTATARDGSFNIDLAPHKSGRTVIRKAGQIAFYCKFHPAMTGVLSVKP
jgi:plastocyanin